MPSFTRGDVSIAYEERGRGFPLLLLAPGGMHSRLAMWSERPASWFDPLTELADEFRVIGMDQRNAGRSSGPVRASDGWHTDVQDALGLLDHLGITDVALIGGCIGVSYALGRCEAAPGRIRAAVLQNPIGATGDDHQHFVAMFDEWAAALRATRSDVDPVALAAMRDRMFSGDFVFSVSRAFVRGLAVPLLVLAGADHFHPPAIAEEIARLAPNARLETPWRPSEVGRAMVTRVREFLRQHTSTGPARAAQS